MTEKATTHTPAENRLLRRCYFVFTVSGLGAVLLGSLMPYLRETYQLSYETSGMLLSAHSIGNLLSTIAAGFLPYLLGRRKSILLCSVWMLAAYILIAFTGMPSLLLVAFFMVGISRGATCNFGNTVVGSISGGARDLNLLHGSFSLGAFISPLLLFLFAVCIPRLGWKAAALVMAVITIVQIFTFWFMQFQDIAPTPKGEKHVDYSFLKNWNYWLCGLILLFYISAEYGISGWLVTYFKESGLMNDGFAQIMSSLLWGEMFLGRMVNAYLSSRVSRSRLLIINGIGFVVFFMILFFSRTMLGIAIGIIGFGFFMAGIYPLALAGVGDKVASNDLAVSLLVTAGSMGGIVMPAIIGFVAGTAGIVGGMSLLVFVVAGTLLLIFAQVFYQHRAKPSNPQ